MYRFVLNALKYNANLNKYKETLFLSVQREFCSVIILPETYSYLLQTNIKADEVCKITMKVFRKCAHTSL
jgi:hypothetical protein